MQKSRVFRNDVLDQLRAPLQAVYLAEEVVVEDLPYPAEGAGEVVVVA